MHSLDETMSDTIVIYVWSHVDIGHVKAVVAVCTSSLPIPQGSSSRYIGKWEKR